MEKTEDKNSNEKSALSGIDYSWIKENASGIAYSWIIENALAFDTETTGLGEKDQIIELALINREGSTVIEMQLKPTVPINPKAQAVHGISEADLKNCPTFKEVAPAVLWLIMKQPLIIFNAEFDLRLLKQTCEAFDIDLNLGDIKAHCAMKLAADYYGATNRHGTISLANAMDRANVQWEGEAHSAEADALGTMNLVKAIAFDPVAPFNDKSQVIPYIQHQIESYSNTLACLQLKLEHCKKRGFDQ